MGQDYCSYQVKGMSITFCSYFSFPLLVLTVFSLTFMWKIVAWITWSIFFTKSCLWFHTMWLLFTTQLYNYIMVLCTSTNYFINFTYEKHNSFILSWSLSVQVSWPNENSCLFDVKWNSIASHVLESTRLWANWLTWAEPFILLVPIHDISWIDI